MFPYPGPFDFGEYKRKQSTPKDYPKGHQTDSLLYNFALINYNLYALTSQEQTRCIQKDSFRGIPPPAFRRIRPAGRGTLPMAAKYPKRHRGLSG